MLPAISVSLAKHFSLFLWIAVEPDSTIVSNFFKEV